MNSLGAKLERWLHPIWKRMTLSSDDSVNNAIIGALDDQLSDSEQRFLKTKVETSLQTADGDWLDKWGYWFGQRRLNGWSDDEYRQHIVYHVTHGRNTIDSIKEAIANFLNVNKDSIYIYEPYRDMFILNDSLLNSNKYLPSTYYRYAVIDIRISSNIPSEVISIINLFRPAGVLWVLTHDINRFDDNAQIFDMESPKKLFEPSINYKYFIGLIKKESYLLTAGNNEYSAIENPFIYNDTNSLLNSNSLLSGTLSTSKQYAIIGQSSFSIEPEENDTLDLLAYKMEQPDTSENKRLINKDGIGHYFSTKLVKDNLVSDANNYINGVAINSNTGYPNLALGTATALTITGNNTVNQVGHISLSKTIAKGTTVTVSFDISSTNTSGKFIIQVSGGNWQQVTANSSNPLTTDVKHYSFTLVTKADFSNILQLRLDNATGTVTVSNFIISESPLEIPYAPAPSDQTTSQSGSLVVPIVNIDSDSSYSFSFLSNSEKDSSKANISLLLKDSLGNDIINSVANSISSGNHILRVVTSTSSNFSSTGYAIIQFSGVSDTDSISISLICLKLVTNNYSISNWSPNSNDEQLANDINVELDVKSFINDNVSTLSSSVTSSDINSMFQNKRFQLTSKLNDITTPEVTVNPYVFNYNANIFMSLESFIADNNGYKDYFIDFNDVTPFINSNGIMSFKLVTENYHNGLSIDYFGLGLYNTSDEVVLKANKSQSGLGLETP